MAVFTATRFSGPAFLGTSVATVLTVPSGRTNVLKQLVFNNTTASAVTVTVHVVPNGGSVLASNAIITTLSIGPSSQIIWSADIPMSAGETLRAAASASNAVTLTATGIDVV